MLVVVLHRNERVVADLARSEVPHLVAAIRVLLDAEVDGRKVRWHVKRYTAVRSPSRVCVPSIAIVSTPEPVQ